jgi:uncharacterized protein (TIRG00374 family)
MRLPLRTIVLVGLTVGLLAYFLSHARLADVWGEVQRARVDLLLFAVFWTSVVYILRAVRWQYLLRPLGPTRFSSALRATLIGFAALFLLPARAGEVLRPYLLARREGLSATAAFATIVVERLLDLVTVALLLGAYLLLFDPGMTRIAPQFLDEIKVGGLVVAAAALVAFAVVFVLAGHPERLERAALRIERVLPARLAQVVARLVRAFAEGFAVMRRPADLLIAGALSVPVWLSIAYGIWLCARAFHITLPYTGTFLLLALLVVGVSVPTPGGIGGFHEAFRLGATAFFGAPDERAIGAAIVLHAISFVPVTLVGLVLMAQEGMSLGRLSRLARTAPAREGEAVG